MPLIALIALLSLLKFLDVALLSDLSWWWIAGLGAMAFLWFEFIEPMLGLDKRKAHDQWDAARQARLKKNFGPRAGTKRR